MPRGDSIGRYENYDLHSVGRPRQNNGLSAHHNRPKDTVETSQERTDRYNPSKIQPSDNRASQDRLVLIGRAGRFVFMAICLPPYFALYGMPKWIAVNLAPQLMKGMNTAAQFSLNVVHNIQAWIANSLVKPFRDACGKINFAIQQLFKGLGGLLSQLKNAVVKPFTFAFSQVAKTVNAATKQFQNLKTSLFDRFSGFFKTAKEMLSKTKMLSEKAVSLVKAPFIRTREMVADIGLMFSNLAKSFQENALKLAKQAAKITEKIGSVSEAAKAKIQQIIALPAAAIVPVINFFVQTRNVIGEWGKFSLKRVKKSEKSRLKKGLLKVKSALDGTKKFFDNLPKKAKVTKAKIKKWLEVTLIDYIHEEIPFLVDAYHFLKQLFAKVRARLQATKLGILRKCQSCASVFKRLYQRVIRFSTRVSLFIKKHFLSGMQVAKQGIYVPFRIVRKIARVLIAMGRGFADLFRELHQEMRSWMS